VHRLLGAGGLGKVEQVYDMERGCNCALKTAQEGDVEDLQKEAAILQMLAPHPNCVQIFDVYEDFYTMEYVIGTPLTTYLEKHVSWPLWFVVPVMRGVFRGLAHYHAAGVCHNDLKPDNIIVRPVDDLPQPVLIDPLWCDPCVPDGIFIGTPEYTAPERMERSNTDYRADLYCAGLVFYELLAGRKPWPYDPDREYKEIPRLYRDRKAGTYPPLARINEYPEWVGILVDALLEPRLRFRPESAEECLEILDEIEEDLNQED